ncbi:hypothetical protein AG1IA_06397 [Rhizoctonia solani AG-1 IA]|uniref:Uncharacterized protein n=1 Tax=Thanatephorus cucumeris (strain AG1-IA) TaxID=983506 RepID=L8WN38_THACA|nr:hypothetical protein AG1IA_06397 [Rhizoctonia solani AG-1 IA]
MSRKLLVHAPGYMRHSVPVRCYNDSLRPSFHSNRNTLTNYGQPFSHRRLQLKSVHNRARNWKSSCHWWELLTTIFQVTTQKNLCRVSIGHAKNLLCTPFSLGAKGSENERTTYSPLTAASSVINIETVVLRIGQSGDLGPKLSRVRALACSVMSADCFFSSAC